MTLPTFTLWFVIGPFRGLMGPSHEWIGALSRSISRARLSKMFALVLHSLATNQLKPLPWPLLAGPFFCCGTSWPAPGSEDTELGVFMGPEVSHGETKVYAGVQA